jgi:hypothetical protein
MWLSRPYKTQLDAVRAGFGEILANSDAWTYNEFGFWVVVQGNQGQAYYHHTAIETSHDPRKVEMVLPNSPMLRAHCHSHPTSNQSPHFSSVDDEMWLTINKQVQQRIVMYLLTPQMQLRLMYSRADFPRGQSVSWTPDN